MDLKDIQRHIDQVMNEQNNRSIPEFEGYSPSEMHQILNFTFENSSPISFQKLTDSDYSKIPMHNQIKYFLDLIKKTGEIKLTAKGFLPTTIVKDIYAQGYLEEPLFTSGTYQFYKESDSMTVNLTRLLVEHGNAFQNTDLKTTLVDYGIYSITVGGLVSHGCVKATCLGGLSEGFEISLLKNGHTNWNKDADAKILEVNATKIKDCQFNISSGNPGVSNPYFA